MMRSPRRRWWPLTLALAFAGLSAIKAKPVPGGERMATPAMQNPDPDAGDELLGRPAPPLNADRWLRTPPLSLERLRGKVVLLRWWTDGCHFCETTLPAIEKLRTARAGGDLVVIGIYHPKPPRRVSDRHVIAAANRLGFGGPLAIDRDWSALERWWLDGHPERNWTSVSFLVGRDGTIRWVHGGGEYHPSADPMHARCALQYRGLEHALSEALAEGRAQTKR